MTLRIGTRRSALATTQTGHVADALRGAGHDVEIVEITTEGDVSTASLASLGGTGVFVSALREALRAGEVDIAVHSLKDIPTADEPGLTIAAVPPRVDPRDSLVARDGLTLGEPRSRLRHRHRLAAASGAARCAGPRPRVPRHPGQRRHAARHGR